MYSTAFMEGSIKTAASPIKAAIPATTLCGVLLGGAYNTYFTYFVSLQSLPSMLMTPSPLTTVH